MTYYRTGRAARGAFTLVEILVVILIIALLVSLLMAGVMKVLVQGPQLKTSSEIRQFDVAIQQFMQEHNVNYIPSYLVIRENNTWNATDPAEINSRNYLQRIFGKNVSLSPPAQYDWNNNGSSVDRLVLEGQHCLTFFLGGIPSTAGGVNTCLGFSTDPTNPAKLGGTRRGPYYQNWESSRLIVGTDSTKSGYGFFVYRDA
jgi:prepilin-type N-terminal cleavage/methylation domain-containing protein